MVAVSKQNVKALFADKKALKRMVEEQNALIGLVPDPKATAEQTRALILADGVRPEDNLIKTWAGDPLRLRGGGMPLRIGPMHE